MGWPKGKPRKAAGERLVAAAKEVSQIVRGEIEPPMEPLDGPWLENDASDLPEPRTVPRTVPSCAICCYWHPTGEIGHGQCRRFPAHPRNNSPYAHWPVMTATDWCGEFKAKD